MTKNECKQFLQEIRKIDPECTNASVTIEFTYSKAYGSNQNDQAAIHNPEYPGSCFVVTGKVYSVMFNDLFEQYETWRREVENGNPT